MPPLNNQITKTLQFHALRIVRTVAATSYRKFFEEESRQRGIFPSNHNHRGSILLSDTYQDQNNNNSSFNQGHMFYLIPSLVETIIATHKNKSSYNTPNVPTRTGRDGKMYP